MNSITYSGSASTGNFGQSKSIAGPLAVTAIANYTRAIDLAQPASRASGTTMPPASPGGPPPQPGTKERILFTGDFNVPAAGQPVSPAIATLVQNVERLKLDFDAHVLVHPPTPDRPMTRADLMALAKGTN